MPALLRSAFILCIVSLFAACESGNDGGELNDLPPDTTPPQIELTNPLITLDGPPFETDQSYRLLFSEQLDLESLSNATTLEDNFKLSLKYAKNTGNRAIGSSAPTLRQEAIAASTSEYLKRTIDPITGQDIDIVANVTTVTPPANQLSLDSIYILEAGNDIKDLSDYKTPNPNTGLLEPGNFIGGSLSYSLRTVKGKWYNEELIPSGPNNSVTVLSSSNETEQIQRPLLFWSEYNLSDNRHTNLVSRLDIATRQWQSLSGTGDSTEVPALASNLEPTSQPHIVSIDESRFVVSWLQKQNSNSLPSGFAAYYDGTGWQQITSAFASGTSNATVTNISLLKDDGDSLRIIWSENTPTESAIWQQHFDPEQSPNSVVSGSTLLLLSEATDQITDIKPSLFEHSLLLSWLTLDSLGTHQVNSSLYDLNSPPTPIGSISSTSGLDAINPHQSANPVSEGYVVWQEQDGSRYNVWRSFFNTQGFSQPELAELDNSGNATNPVSASCFGLDAALFYQKETNNGVDLVSTSYSSTDGWGDLITHESVSANSNLELGVSYDTSCNLHATWASNNSATTQDAYYSVVDNAWEDTESIQTNYISGTSTSSPVLLVNAGVNGRLVSLRTVDVNNRTRIAFSVHDE